MGVEKPDRVRTSTLLNRLFSAKNLPDFLETNQELLRTPVFNCYIQDLCQKMGLVPEQIINRTGIERTYGHQLFNGTRKPSRDKVLQLALGFGLDAMETQELLTIAQKSLLYPRIKRDAVILYCLNNQKSELEAQVMLAELKLTLLGGSKDG